MRVVALPYLMVLCFLISLVLASLRKGSIDTHERALNSSPSSEASLSTSRLDKRGIYTWGPYRVWLWRSAAVVPVIAAVPDMKRFWTDLAMKGSELAQEATISQSFEHALGAMQVVMTTPDGSALDWDFLTFLGSKMMQLTALGWTNHYVGSFTNLRTQQVVVVTLQAVVGAGMTSMGTLLLGLDSAGQSFQQPGPNGGAPNS